MTEFGRDTPLEPWNVKPQVIMMISNSSRARNLGCV